MIPSRAHSSEFRRPFPSVPSASTPVHHPDSPRPESSTCHTIDAPVRIAGLRHPSFRVLYRSASTRPRVHDCPPRSSHKRSQSTSTPSADSPGRGGRSDGPDGVGTAQADGDAVAAGERSAGRLAAERGEHGQRGRRPRLVRPPHLHDRGLHPSRPGSATLRVPVRQGGRGDPCPIRPCRR